MIVYVIKGIKASLCLSAIMVTIAAPAFAKDVPSSSPRVENPPVAKVAPTSAPKAIESRAPETRAAETKAPEPRMSLSGSPKPIATQSPRVNENPSPTSSAVSKAQQVLSDQQKTAIADAKAAYTKAAQQALDGANRAVADAKSLLQQELQAAGKDKTLKAMAQSDYKKNTAAIWSAFKQSTTEAKATLDSSLNSIKNAIGN